MGGEENERNVKSTALPLLTVEVISTPPVTRRGQNAPVHVFLNHCVAAIEWNVLCTPGTGVSVGVQVPCRRFTLMSHKLHENNYESKARASPRGEV
jgi:hypothetical protein